MKSFDQLRKNLKYLQDHNATTRLAILADNATQLMATAIRGYGWELGWNIAIRETGFDQFEQQILDPRSELYAFQPDYIYLNFSTPAFLEAFYHTPADQRADFYQQRLNRITSLVTGIQQHSSAPIIINTLIEINDGVFGQYAAKTDTASLYQLRKFNLALMELAQQQPSLYINDLLAIQTAVGLRHSFDPRLSFHGQLDYSLDFLPLLAKSLCEIMASLQGRLIKCIVLDLDNTLWGGTIGDDGLEGIQIGNLGIGKAFSLFQHWLKELKNRGILLTVCSKNSEAMAKEPFLHHPDMVLRLEDIAIFIANWENKSDNIRQIREQLNIATDAMLFLDDSKFERELVRAALPDLQIPELPEDPADFMSFLGKLNLFETGSLSKEDADRTRYIQHDLQRRAAESVFTSTEAFLQSLQMMATVQFDEPFQAPRIAQLTQRSNQFNLSASRYTEEEILQFMRSPDYTVISFTLEDQFGSHGLISAVILKKTSADCFLIDTWVMSCRILKRGMEQFILNTLVDRYHAEKTVYLRAGYRPTTRNGLIASLLPSLGFSAIGTNEWQLETGTFIPEPVYIALKA